MSGEREFGRYRLVKRLAVGGMAEIWLARQAGPGGFEKHLVIKRILSHLAMDEDFVRMFLDEARLAAMLSHPNIASVTDFGEEGDSYYLAMELVRGPDLRRLITACKKGKLEIPFRLAARVISQTCAALDYAHKAVDSNGDPLNIIHRDVSPQNILVSLNGTAKLVDFGIAKAVTQVQHTQGGMVKGKFAYMAPEQIKGEPLDWRCDVFAAGLVLYELLTGQPAYKAEGQMAILNAIEGKIQPAGELRPDLPAGLSTVLETALQKDRERRYPDAGAMEAALELYLTQLGKPVTSRDIAEFMKGVQIDSGDPLSMAGTGSFEKAEIRRRAAAVSSQPATPPPSPHPSPPAAAQSLTPAGAAPRPRTIPSAPLPSRPAPTPRRAVPPPPAPLPSRPAPTPRRAVPPPPAPIEPEPEPAVDDEDRGQATVMQEAPHLQNGSLGNGLVPASSETPSKGVSPGFESDLPQSSPGEIDDPELPPPSDTQEFRDQATRIAVSPPPPPPASRASAALEQAASPAGPSRIPDQSVIPTVPNRVPEQSVVPTAPNRVWDEPAAELEDITLAGVPGPPKNRKFLFLAIAGGVCCAIVAAVALTGNTDPAPKAQAPVAVAPPAPVAPVVAAIPEATAPEEVPDPVPAEPEAPPPAPDVVAPSKEPDPAPVAAAPAVAIPPKEPEPAPVAAAPEPAKVERPRDPKPAPPPKEPKVAAATPTPQRAAAAPGTLSLAAQPWMNVTLDGEPLGQTPIVKLEVKVGKHKVAMVNPQLGLSRTLEFEIKSGEERKEVVRFAKSKVTFIVAPWGEIKVGEKVVGQTPMPPHELYEGAYQVTATNPDSGKKLTRDIQVESGKDQVVKFDLR